MRNLRIGGFVTHELAPLFRRVSRVHNAALAPFELRAVEAHILATLSESGPMTVGTLQGHLGLRGSTLTGALDRLEKRELLLRRPSPSDRRSWVLEAATMPAKTRAGLMKALKEAEQRCWGGLSAAERAQLLKLLRKANQTLAEEGP